MQLESRATKHARSFSSLWQVRSPTERGRSCPSITLPRLQCRAEVQDFPRTLIPPFRTSLHCTPARRLPVS